eukprot:CAMPEP_0197886976 /NCGR_PEP_ID=MMETSP1439-20131203/18609_1 /TAXON_ID=66791 /ORGANISM="Gonyaulax spinifera, Strain CCMP409" /LENGTH=219 /DNA_ID=CAMNT_0043506797 /DNA_START=72 /DNA_END=727 /DNA_ORIENTATION=-
MAIAASAAVAATAVLASAAAMRAQRKHVAALEETVGGLQQKAQQFEAVPRMMSLKRREAVDATKTHISEIEAKQLERDEDIMALSAHLASLMQTVTQLQEKAVQFESVPKMLSVKRRQVEEAYQVKDMEKDEQLAALNKNVLCVLEHMEAIRAEADGPGVQELAWIVLLPALAQESCCSNRVLRHCATQRLGGRGMRPGTLAVSPVQCCGVGTEIASEM